MPAAVSPKNTLPADYRPGTWDEMLGADGRVNPSWSHVASWLGGLTPEQAGATTHEINRLLRQRMDERSTLGDAARALAQLHGQVQAREALATAAAQTERTA